MKARTWIILGAVLIAVIVVVVVSTRSSGTPVEVAEVRRGTIEAFVDERGKTRLPRTYLITMPYAGRIEAISLREGDAVKKNDLLEPVARVVRQDVELNVEEAQAVVDRLKASIAENLDTKLEKLAGQQAEDFNNSMVETVKAAAARMISGQKKYEVALSRLGRIEKLDKKGTTTTEELEQAELAEVQSRIDFRQDELVKNAMVSMAAATSLLPTMVDQYIKNKNLRDAVLQNQKAEADARLKRAELERQRGTITSHVDGVVLKRLITNERFLPAGEPLVEIGRLEDLQVEADVLSLDVVEVKEGDRVEIYGPAIGKNVRGIENRNYAAGKVEKVYPAGFTKISSLGVEQQRVKVIVRFQQEDLDWLSEHRGLGVGYRVRVRITTESNPDALIVPRSALFRGTGATWQLYAVRDGRAKIQTVKVGILNDRHAEITEGLEKGDLVVRAPESNLEEGQRVKAARPKKQPPAQPPQSQPPAQPPQSQPPDPTDASE